MRIAVCDDEKIFLSSLDRMISDQYRTLDTITDLFTDGRELLKSFETRAFRHDIKNSLNMLNIMLAFLTENWSSCSLVQMSGY